MNSTWFTLLNDHRKETATNNFTKDKISCSDGHSSREFSQRNECYTLVSNSDRNLRVCNSSCSGSNWNFSTNSVRPESQKSCRYPSDYNELISASSNENLPPEKRSKNRAQRVVLTVRKLRSVSYLQEKNAVVNISEIKVRSKTILKSKQLRRSNYRDESLLFRDPGRNKKTDHSDAVKTEGGNPSFSKNARTAEDRLVGDALFSYPLELIEIYSGKKKQIDSLKLDNATRDWDSMRSFPQENSSYSSKHDAFAEPTRDQVIEVVSAKTFENYSRDEILEQEQQENVDYCDINVCNILTEIHAQLTCNWQKVDSLRLKLRNGVPIESITSTEMIQLLGKTIARCKSYIHSSNNSDEAAIRINKLLSKYVIKLMRSVNIDKLALEEQEQQYEQVQFDAAKSCKRIIPISSRRKNEISELIEKMSCLMKGIMVENEEKENVKASRKYKSNYRHTTSSLSANNNRSRNVTPRLKSTKLNLVKKDSSIETQMGVTVNSKDFTTEDRLRTYKNREKERIIDDMQGNVINKQFIENKNRLEKGRSTGKSVNVNAASNQSRQSVSRQKNRTSINVQPVWRPAGIVRIPSSSSATSLMQKSRPSPWTYGKEKINPSAEHTKYPCQKRQKITRKKSDSSVKPKSTSKPRPGTPRVASKHRENESPRRNSDITRPQKLPSTLSWDKVTFRKKPPRESEIIRALEETIKSMPVDEKQETKESTNLNPTTRPRSPDRRKLQDPTDSISLEHLNEFTVQKASTLIKDEIKNNEEEPTRDVDSSGLIKSQCKANEAFHVDKVPLQLSDKLLEKTSFASPVLSKDLDRSSTDKLEERILDSGINVNFDNNSASNLRSSLVSLANASCTAEFSSSSDSTARIVSSKCCQTSLNSPSSSSTSSSEAHSPQKNQRILKNTVNTSQTLSFDTEEHKQSHKNEKESKDSAAKQEKAKANSHMISLNMLKEFLCGQGVDVDLVNRAERHLKEKQKTGCKNFKKKSVVFADAKRFAKENQSSEANSKREAVADDCEGNVCDNNKSSLQIKSRKVDNATCTIINSQDVSSQTSFLWETSKSTQTVPEENISAPLIKLQAAETQTESSVRHVGTECHEEASENSTRVSSITQTTPKRVNDSSTETVSTVWISKSVATEDDDYICINKCKRKIESTDKKSPSNFPVKSSNKFQDELKETIVQCSIKKNPRDPNEMLDQIRESQDDKFSTNCRDNGGMEELYSVKSNTASSSSSSQELSVKSIPSEVITALQIAAIRARNVRRAIDIYKQNLRGQALQKPGEQNEGKVIETKTRNKKRRSKKLCRSSSNIVTSIQSDFNENCNTIEVPKLKAQNNSSRLSVKCRDFRDESGINILKSDQDTDIDAALSIENNIQEKVDSPILKKTSSSVVLRDVKSVMEFLLRRAEDGEFDEVYYVRKVSSANDFYSTCLQLHNGKLKAEKSVSRLSILSRENLLPLVYGVVCSIVFWCLQFSIKCEFGTSRGA